MLLYRNLSDAYLMIRLGLGVFERKIKWGKCQFYHVITREHAVNTMTTHIYLDHLAEIVLLVSPLQS
jgi:hypothetical protein